MKVKVKLNLGLEKYSEYEENPMEIGIKEAVKVQWILDYFNFPRGEVGVIVVNGELKDIDTMIYSNDYIELYPIFGGG